MKAYRLASVLALFSLYATAPHAYQEPARINFSQETARLMETNASRIKGNGIREVHKKMNDGLLTLDDGLYVVYLEFRGKDDSVWAYLGKLYDSSLEIGSKGEFGYKVPDEDIEFFKKSFFGREGRFVGAYFEEIYRDNNLDGEFDSGISGVEPVYKGVISDSLGLPERSDMKPEVTAEMQKNFEELAKRVIGTLKSM